MKEEVERGVGRLKVEEERKVSRKEGRDGKVGGSVRGKRMEWVERSGRTGVQGRLEEIEKCREGLSGWPWLHGWRPRAGIGVRIEGVVEAWKGKVEGERGNMEKVKLHKVQRQQT